ncbi:GNAT family N-acetyltransferase [Halococcoides cellulosivorans]|uniref:GNAT family N-acetyltransferase n=1 Tax=Halococcoides cellulosivorans TaxID=1679096 RepID=A0A2R4X0V2_9EURY|nr:GNAT family N-acetyltransferase [Halococcoides cellulosivorans]AWB27427.1 GNAT family N-acetyltransferase [Halococcoides cellulosivorans]
MYVRDAKNREEVWLLDRIEEMGLDETSFRSRDYVIAIDEDSGEKAGFGRRRVHKTDENRVCEVTSIGVVEEWRNQGVGAHVLERLVQHAADDDFETLYALSDRPEYLAQFGFESIAEGDLPAPLADRLTEKRESIQPDAVPLALAIDQFSVPTDHREAFKAAEPDREESAPETSPEEFGIDPEEATYKYDTGD